MAGKKKKVALILAILFGVAGIDSLYLGYTKRALIKFVTAGLFGVWWIYDIWMIASNKMTDADGGDLI